MPALGTRVRQNFHNERNEQGSMTKSYTRDLGMAKLVQGVSATFSASSGEISAANGTFATFAVNDDVTIEGANLNNGDFHVTGIDSVNQSYLVLDPPPKNESATVTVRSLF